MKSQWASWVVLSFGLSMVLLDQEGLVRGTCGDESEKKCIFDQRVK